MKESLKDIFLMGLGAVSLTGEKALELKDDLLKRGTTVYEKGKIANEELKHNIKEKIKENVTVVQVIEDESFESLTKKIESLSDEEKEFLSNLLDKNNSKEEKDENEE